MAEPTSDEPKGSGFRIPPWDPEAVLRRRAASARADRDTALRDLQRQLTDAEIPTRFGIAIDQIQG
ncbi:hypothetical protein GCM10011575_31270 [Microlunatus endophyticus]|uniref:Uncharacterized protein n=1 Tax=Microlunatus endophyticus TaxID=1716077 RepID=A0A917SE01_9ACTN|nr:hypothetical protein [Microlunatus endophyticus]GGL70551.1 hypothetical protein GCM10011575_31270 [Microlunatus endophyticus]